MSFSMNDDPIVPNTTLPYPAGSKVTRIPLYINGFPEQIVAKVKQPQLKSTPLSTNLKLIPPEIVADDENRFKTLEKKDSARSTWTLRDETHATQYSGSAEQGDANNRYYLLYTDLTGAQNKCHLLNIKQLNLQKVNTAVRFKSLEEVEAFKKARSKMNAQIKPHDLGIDDDIEDVKRNILTDKLKQQAKATKKAGSGAAAKPKSSRSGTGGFGKDDEFDYDDGEEVWEVADDDEGIQGKDLNDFEDTGDWAGGDQPDWLVVDEANDVDDTAKDIDDLNSEYFGVGVVGTAGSSDDDDDDFGGDVVGAGVTATVIDFMATPNGVGPKRRHAPALDGLGDEEDDAVVGQGKRPKSLIKKK